MRECELNFIWGKMRTAAQERAPQKVLRNYSKVVVKGKSIYKISVKEEFNAIKCLLSRFSASVRN